MAIYVTEHTLTGLTDSHVQSLQSVLRQTSIRLTDAGKPIRLLCCSRPTPHRLVCTFAASSEAFVRQAMDIAQLPRANKCRRIRAGTHGR
jgi:hypothetical protein